MRCLEPSASWPGLPSEGDLWGRVSGPCPSQRPGVPRSLYLSCPSWHPGLLHKGPDWRSGRERERAAGGRPQGAGGLAGSSRPGWEGCGATSPGDATLGARDRRAGCPHLAALPKGLPLPSRPTLTLPVQATPTEPPVKTLPVPGARAPQLAWTPVGGSVQRLFYGGLCSPPDPTVPRCSVTGVCITHWEGALHVVSTLFGVAVTDDDILRVTACQRDVDSRGRHLPQVPVIALPASFAILVILPRSGHLQMQPCKPPGRSP